jgi:hypothetical protein
MDESGGTKAARAKAIAAKKAASSVTGAPGAYHTPRPANDESNWLHRDPNGYIFLGRAAQELALLQYQARWAELDPQQRKSVEDQIIAACESGAVSSFYKSPGGEMKRLAPSLWNADDIESVFVEFKIEIEGAKIGDSCLPVFLARDGLLASFPTSDGAAANQGRRGRPEQFDWDAAHDFAKSEFFARGDFARPECATDGWRSQADLEKLLLTRLEHDAVKEGKSGPVMSTVRRHITSWLPKWRKENSDS